MYHYIYDSFLNGRKHQRALEQVETRIGHCGIQGRIQRLSILHHQAKIIEECVRQRATTIILLGNDRTAVQSIDTFAKLGIPFGFIPIGTDADNRLARTLGIPLGADAVDMLARRRVMNLDLGAIGNRFFLTSATLQATSFECIGMDNAFRITPRSDRVTLTVTNLGLTIPGVTAPTTGNPRDGLLDLLIYEPPSRFARMLSRPAQDGWSVVPITEIRILAPEGATITLDGLRTAAVPATVRVVPKRLKIIVGRDYLF